MRRNSRQHWWRIGRSENRIRAAVVQKEPRHAGSDIHRDQIAVLPVTIHTDRSRAWRDFKGDLEIDLAVRYEKQRSGIVVHEYLRTVESRRQRKTTWVSQVA